MRTLQTRPAAITDKVRQRQQDKQEQKSKSTRARNLYIHPTHPLASYCACQWVRNTGFLALLSYEWHSHVQALCKEKPEHTPWIMWTKEREREREGAHCAPVWNNKSADTLNPGIHSNTIKPLSVIVQHESYLDLYVSQSSVKGRKYLWGATCLPAEVSSLPYQGSPLISLPPFILFPLPALFPHVPLPTSAYIWI